MPIHWGKWQKNILQKYDFFLFNNCNKLVENVIRVPNKI